VLPAYSLRDKHGSLEDIVFYSRLYYSNLAGDIAERHVLLLEPMRATGGSALTAVKVLLDGSLKIVSSRSRIA
jgi:uracil phosphoribosyltransferase